MTEDIVHITLQVEGIRCNRLYRYSSASLCLLLELVSRRDEKKKKRKIPGPQNRILAPLTCYFQNFCPICTRVETSLLTVLTIPYPGVPGATLITGRTPTHALPPVTVTSKLLSSGGPDCRGTLFLRIKDTRALSLPTINRACSITRHFSREILSYSINQPLLLSFKLKLKLKFNQ